MGVDRPGKRVTAPKNKKKLGLYSNEGAKYAGVASQAFPGQVSVDHSFPWRGGIPLF